MQGWTCCQCTLNICDLESHRLISQSYFSTVLLPSFKFNNVFLSFFSFLRRGGLPSRRSECPTDDAWSAELSVKCKGLRIWYCWGWPSEPLQVMLRDHQDCTQLCSRSHIARKRTCVKCFWSMCSNHYTAPSPAFSFQRNDLVPFQHEGNLYELLKSFL